MLYASIWHKSIIFRVTLMNGCSEQSLPRSKVVAVHGFNHLNKRSLAKWFPRFGLCLHRASAAKAPAENPEHFFFSMRLPPNAVDHPATYRPQGFRSFCDLRPLPCVDHSPYLGRVGMRKVPFVLAVTLIRPRISSTLYRMSRTADM